MLGSAMSYWFCKAPAIGASGAIFGLVGHGSVCTTPLSFQLKKKFILSTKLNPGKRKKKLENLHSLLWICMLKFSPKVSTFKNLGVDLVSNITVLHAWYYLSLES